MGKTLSILSVDLSYFQTITETILDQYPEGKDVSSDMTELIWSSYYAKNNSALSSIKTNADEIKKITDCINLCNKSIPVIISENHRPIYEFICNQMHDTKSIKLHLLHIDMYHDMFNENYDIDNGNWIKFISEDFDTYIEWITNPISKSLYGLDTPQFKNILTQIPDLSESTYFAPAEINGIFICKNTALLPPHLDPDFQPLINSIKSTFSNTKILGQADKIRDIEELILQKRTLLST